MPVGIGYTFAPGSESQMGQGQAGLNGPRPSGLSPQAAVKLLQLRVPERHAENAIAPQALLKGPGAAAFGGGGLQAIIQALMQQQGGARMPFGGGPSMASQGDGISGPRPQPRVGVGLHGIPTGPIVGPENTPTGGISQDMINQLLDMDLGGGRTLRKRGGFAGDFAGVGGESPQYPTAQYPQIQAPPLF